MKYAISLLFFLCSYMYGLAQIEYEKGYFIKNNGDTVKCLIKNIDWRYNPEGFNYKLKETSIDSKMNIAEAIQFGIDGISEFKKYSGEIDISSDNLDDLSIKREPEFDSDTVFFKVLVKGKAELYSYENNQILRYFLKVDNSDIEQLIYKKYYIDDSKTTHEYNNTFRQQLLRVLKCIQITPKDFQNLMYNGMDLVKIVEQYNSCNSSTSYKYTNKNEKNRDKFSLSVKGGGNQNSLYVRNDFVVYRSISFETKLTYRIGIEAEFTLPFNKNKWTIFLDANFQSYKAEKIVTTSSINKLANVEYKFIEIPIGFRYYFFLKNSDRIFVNAALNLDKTINSFYQFSSSRWDLGSTLSPSFGIGYYSSNKLCAEIRYRLPRGIMHYNNWISNYNSLSIILGYKFYKR